MANAQDRREIAAKMRRHMMYAGIPTVGSAALALYTLKESNNGWLPLAFSAVGTVGAFVFCSKLRRYYSAIPRRRRQKFQLKSRIATGVIAYCGGVWTLSECVKDNSRLWIPCLVNAVCGYSFAVRSANDLGRTILNRTPLHKLSLLMFGPALLTGAGVFLRCIQGHEEEWLYCLPLIACCAVGFQVGVRGSARVESNNEPRWLLFKGMELMFAGCLITIASTIISIHAANNDYNPFFTMFFTAFVFWGATDVTESLETFQLCTEMEAFVFYCLSGMIIGHVVFLSACMVINVVRSYYAIPFFLTLAGTGITVLVLSTANLYDRLPRPRFYRYCKRTYGPWCMIYSILASSYIGYRMGWRCALAPAPLLSAGLFLTYKGFKN